MCCVLSCCSYSLASAGNVCWAKPNHGFFHCQQPRVVFFPSAGRTRSALDRRRGVESRESPAHARRGRAWTHAKNSGISAVFRRHPRVRGAQRTMPARVRGASAEGAIAPLPTIEKKLATDPRLRVAQADLRKNGAGAAGAGRRLPHARPWLRCPRVGTAQRRCRMRDGCIEAGILRAAPAQCGHRRTTLRSAKAADGRPPRRSKKNRPQMRPVVAECTAAGAARPAQWSCSSSSSE